MFEVELILIGVAILGVYTLVYMRIVTGSSEGDEKPRTQAVRRG